MPMATSRRRKAMGQHFLTDGRIADRIVAAADLDPTSDAVLEIGSGTGILTRRLAPKVKGLLCIEKDASLAHKLQLELATSGNVRVEEGDALEHTALIDGSHNKIVANLPYSVSTPITFRLLPAKWETAVLMYQEEFARRLAAEVGKPDYGRLSAARAFFATCDYLFNVPRGAFAPPPQVQSGVVRLRRHRRPPFEASSTEEYLELLRVAFSTRRKTLRATLRHQFKQLGLPGPEPAEHALLALGLAQQRPEQVAPADFGRLTLHLAEAKGHG